MLGTWRFMTLVFLKQGQGRGDGHQAFTLALAFFFYRTRVLPFSQHLPHPPLSHAPFFLHPIHHTSPFTHSNPDNWLGPKIHSQDPNTWPFILIQFSSFCFSFYFHLLFPFQFYFTFIFIFIYYLNFVYHFISLLAKQFWKLTLLFETQKPARNLSSERLYHITVKTIIKHEWTSFVLYHWNY